MFARFVAGMTVASDLAQIAKSITTQNPQLRYKKQPFDQSRKMLLTARLL
jgi:hypothetical protein